MWFSTILRMASGGSDIFIAILLLLRNHFVFQGIVVFSEILKIKWLIFSKIEPGIGRETQLHFVTDMEERDFCVATVALHNHYILVDNRNVISLHIVTDY